MSHGTPQSLSFAFIIKAQCAALTPLLLHLHTCVWWLLLVSSGAASRMHMMFSPLLMQIEGQLQEGGAVSVTPQRAAVVLEL